MFEISEKGNITIDINIVTNKPIINQTIESKPQIIHKASLTVKSHKIPSKLSSNIKPKGALNERQKNKNTFINAHSPSSERKPQMN